MFDEYIYVTKETKSEKQMFEIWFIALMLLKFLISQGVMEQLLL